MSGFDFPFDSPFDIGAESVETETASGKIDHVTAALNRLCQQWKGSEYDPNRKLG